MLQQKNSMEQRYNQWKAMFAITKASLKAIFRSPQSVFFSLFFPVILIVIFSALSSGRGISLDVAIGSGSDTVNVIYKTIKNIRVLTIVKGSEEQLEDKLKKGRITAIIEIRQKVTDTMAIVGAAYDVHLRTTSAGQKDLPILQTILRDVIGSINRQSSGSKEEFASVSVEEVPGRVYKMIDFYLPGMLGFSLMGAAVFGVAFVFFSFRETLVLKRMYSTPIRKKYIVLGESIGRIIFQLTTAIVLILFGTLFYDFTLSNGWVTFIELIVLSLMGLIMFMGFGFIISSVAKNQNVIPIYANLFMFPQYFLSGTFFPKGALPQAAQPIINLLPLTVLNDAMRKISFEGLHLWNAPKEIIVMLVWILLIYTVAVKVFKWE